MADKIYQTEGVIKMAASVAPKSPGYFLMTADDIQVGENKSLAEYIAEGGGGSGGSSVKCAIKVVSADLTKSNTLEELRTILRNNGVTATEMCLVKSTNTSYLNRLPDTIVQISDLGVFFQTITITVWYRFDKGYNLKPLTNIGFDPTTPISEIEQLYNDCIFTNDKTTLGAINELEQRVEVPPYRPIDVGYNLMIGEENKLTWAPPTGEYNAMPTIRFVGLRGNNYLSNLDGEEQSVQFTAEVLDGSLQVGDTLQMCAMRTYSESHRNLTKKRKLRRFAEYEITEEDLNKRFLTLTVYPSKNTFAFLAHNNRQSGGPCNYFFRIRRPVGDLQTNDSGMTVDAKFSNIVPVSMLNVCIDTQEDEEGNKLMGLKINVL